MFFLKGLQQKGKQDSCERFTSPLRPCYAVLLVFALATSSSEFLSLYNPLYGS